MRVSLTGSSGLVGRALAQSLAASGHEVLRLVRSKSGLQSGEFYWNPQTGELDRDGLEGADAVVHLAGETIAARWTPARKALIRDSRIWSTRLLAETLGSLQRPPSVFISSSAIGYYGDRGSELLREESSPGSGFLSEVCRAWESETERAEPFGVRVVRLRTGIVLSAAGGALAKMLLAFRLGLGGRLGSGDQYMSWISLEDTVGAITHALLTEKLRGPVNMVAPNPVTNREFTAVLGKVLGRPTIFPVPAFALRLAAGEMGEELLLSSARVEPAKLKSSGYLFRHPTLEQALRSALGR